MWGGEGELLGIEVKAQIVESQEQTTRSPMRYNRGCTRRARLCPCSASAKESEATRNESINKNNRYVLLMYEGLHRLICVFKEL